MLLISSALVPQAFSLLSALRISPCFWPSFLELPRRSRPSNYFAALMPQTRQNHRLGPLQDEREGVQLQPLEPVRGRRGRIGSNRDKYGRSLQTTTKIPTPCLREFTGATHDYSHPVTAPFTFQKSLRVLASDMRGPRDIRTVSVLW